MIATGDGRLLTLEGSSLRSVSAPIDGPPVDRLGVILLAMQVHAAPQRVRARREMKNLQACRNSFKKHRTSRTPTLCPWFLRVPAYRAFRALNSGAARSLAAMSSPPVPLSDLLTVAVQGAHGGLLRLSQQVDIPMSDQQRRKAILDYVAHAQGLLMRLLVLVRWSSVQQVVGAPRAAGQKALTLLELQLSEMRRAADELFFFHEASRA